MFIFLFLFAFLNQAASFYIPPFPFPNIVTNFSIPSFTPLSCNDGLLTCMGSVTGGNGYLSLTPELQLRGNTTLPQNQVGRVLYKYRVLAWPALIDTTFTFRIIPSPCSTNDAADGLTFIMAPNNSPSPSSSYGSYLGVMDPTQDGLAVGQLAVEFDTFKNTFDLDGNHIAVDTKSMINPVRVRSLSDAGIELKDGKDIKVRIVLDGKENFLRVYVGYASDTIFRFFFDAPIDILHTLPKTIYVGFTASTGSLTERHQLLNWKFSSIPMAK